MERKIARLVILFVVALAFVLGGIAAVGAVVNQQSTQQNLADDTGPTGPTHG